MKANGSGQMTVGKWTQIPASTNHHSPPKHSHPPHYYMNNNPYEVLSDSSIHNLTKLVLPNGETFFSSFHSIEALSAYFSKILLTHKTPTKLVPSALNNEVNVNSFQTSLQKSQFFNDKHSHNKKNMIKIIRK